MGRFRSITHPFAARQHVLLHLLPLDLHVLGTPPAFNLSQDQTLHLKNLKHRNEWLKKDSLLDFFGHSVFALKASTRVPTQITCKLLNSFPAAVDWDGDAKLSPVRRRAHRAPSAHSAACLIEGGGSIAFAKFPSTVESLLFSPRCRCACAAVAARGRA